MPYSEKVYGEHSYEVLTSSREGLQRQSDHFATEQRHDTDGYNVIPFGYCTYRNRSDDGKFTFNMNKISENGIVSKFYPVFTFENANSEFMIEYLNSSENIKKKLAVLAVGTSQVVLSFEALKKAQFPIPCKAEQDRIAALLECINRRIVAQSKIVDSLKKYKRGLLSSLFERCIRFKDNDGSEFPEWEQRKLISCCNGFDNLRQPITANLRRKGKYPYYGANGIQDYVDDYIFDGEYILLAEDGGHFDEFASKPIAQFICGRVWVNNHAHIIQAKQGYNNKYIFYCLEHKDIRKYINGSSRAKLNQEDMWDIPIPVPCLREQERIADFMTAIDCSINDHERRLEMLRDLKTGLLQQLFI